MGSSGGGGSQGPMQMSQGMMDTVMDPQKLISGFVGPTAAGIKQPPPKGTDYKPPATAMTPTSFGDLQSKYSVGAGGGGGDMMDPETMKFLQQLAGGR